MKRIASIQIENYRAFFGNYNLELPKGENLLLYGENGSGKSSLFKGLYNYLESSRNPAITFTKNHYSAAPDGAIRIAFQDFDDNSFQPVAGTQTMLHFGSAASNHNIQFVKDAELVKGFLDYRNLLDVYFHDEPKPNLFNLIVLQILGRQLNNARTFRFADQWASLQKDLIEGSYNRNTRKHQNALHNLPVFQAALETALKDVFRVLNNTLLKKYFPELDIQLRFELKPIVFNYETYKWEWYTTADLRLKVIQHGQEVQDDYSDFLNEARLSAFAVCIYLSAILRNPELIDYKILFLDDVFIGLDASNRMPILSILEKEFPKHQIFITTYDRHFFELAKRKFESETPGKWKTFEFYVGKKTEGNQHFEVPIVVEGKSYYESAIMYLHDRVRPDYPAAANYFRKALEETIQLFIPSWETADLDSSSQLPEYKLGPLIYRAKRFLDKTGNDSSTINQIIGLLPALLHPLSHHDIKAPVYKGELLLIEGLIPKWKEELKALNIPENYKCSKLEGRNKIRIKYVFNDATGHFGFYELKTSEPLCLKVNPGGQPAISKVHCQAIKCWSEENSDEVPGGKTFSKEERAGDSLNFASLKDAYDRLYAFVIGHPGRVAFPKAANYLDAIEYQDMQHGNFHPIVSIIVW